MRIDLNSDMGESFGRWKLGDDHALRTWWGLRRKLTPKQYQDDLAQRKCQAVAQAYNLSSREYDVLLLLAQGRRASQIKDDLFISINTVRTHKSRAYKVLRIVLSNQWMLF